MIRRPPRSTQSRSSAASDVYKRQGQVVSLVGSAMTAFGIGVWAWQVTGRATALSIVAFFSFTPIIIMSPIAGALVDRWIRKVTMGVSDVVSGLGTVIMLVLYAT